MGANALLYGSESASRVIGYQTLLVVFLVRQVGLSPATVGLLLTLTALGGIAGAVQVQPLVRLLGDARTLVLGKAGAGPCALVIPFTDRGAVLGLFAVVSTLVTLGVTAGNVVSASFRRRWIDPGMLSRVMTSIQVVNVGTIQLGAASAGHGRSAGFLRACRAGFARPQRPATSHRAACGPGASRCVVGIWEAAITARRRSRPGRGSANRPTQDLSLRQGPTLTPCRCPSGRVWMTTSRS